VYRGREKVKILATGDKVGVCGARNAGIGVAQGEIVAFTDDDVVADSRWIESLVDTYERFDAIAVGGKILPMWLTTEPDHFPAELGWLVGITHNGFAEEEVSEVRNTFGPNMSYRSEVFEKIGVFNERFGLGARDAVQLQGEEAELALRMKQVLGRSVTYNPQAVVYHKIPPWKTTPRWMLRRAFYQGYSKALLRRSIPCHDTLSVEQAYLRRLLLKYAPSRTKRLLLRSDRGGELRKLGILAASVFSASLGFLCGFAKKTPHGSA
jgi:GT2 family glycosyltransferase